MNSVVNFITGLEEDIDMLRSPVKVHSLILYHCSDYFKGAMTTDMIEKGNKRIQVLYCNGKKVTM